VLFWYVETVHAHVEIAMTGRIGFVQRIGQTRVGGVDDEVTGANLLQACRIGGRDERLDLLRTGRVL
jgi:hypothetical protein